MGDWDFLHWWWWRPIVEPLAGLAWLGLLLAAGVALYLLFGRREMAGFRDPLREGALPAPPGDEEALARYLEENLPEVSEEEILEMEEILEAVLAEDIHPGMRAEIGRRGIPVRLLALPDPQTVKDVGVIPVAVWIPAENAVEIYAALVKEECGGDPARTRRLMGELLLHEIGHALGLGESEIKDFGV